MTNLNLTAVQIDGDDTIDAHRLQQTRNVSGRNGHTRLHFAILKQHENSNIQTSTYKANYSQVDVSESTDRRQT
jgi:hypothetical protein